MEFERINLCCKCGMCCRAIVIACVTRKHWLEMKLRKHEFKESEKFMFENWIMIPEVIAVRLNPELKKEYIPKVKKLHDEDILFFRCSKFDSKNNICTVHDKRPWVCSGFPFYKGSAGWLKDLTLLSPGWIAYSSKCGYNVVKLTKEWINEINDKCQGEFSCDINDYRNGIVDKEGKSLELIDSYIEDEEDIQS